MSEAQEQKRPLHGILPAFKEVKIERDFLRADARRTRRFIRLLALLSIVVTILTWHGSLEPLAHRPHARTIATVLKGLFAALCIVLLWLSQRDTSIFRVYDFTSLIYLGSVIVISLRMSAMDQSRSGLLWEVVHVTRDGMTAWLVVSAAVLLFVPGHFLTNLIISLLGFCFAFVMMVYSGLEHPLQAFYVYGTAYLITLAMSGHFQRLQRKHYQLILDLQDANGRLEHLASTDPLTGILNRRSFVDALEREYRRCVRHKEDLALVLFDLDFFKEINDNHGHPAGDAVLRAMAGAVHEQIRKEDYFARLGGEEFALLLPETDPPHANQFSERIRQTIENLRIAFNRTQIGITASFGVTYLHPDDDNEDAILIRADRALYEAKKKGRNQVVVVQYANSDDSSQD
ncbi:MAG: GGDEF domain-containing protein [Leptospiraceae bacterium]|nr:GGDEF domain-containing protein [Leptospiraceae bacterium]